MSADRAFGRRWLILASTAALVACSTMTPPAGNSPQADTREPVEAWSHVLRHHVNPAGQVDFAGVARAPAPLNRYVAWIAENGPRTQPALYPDRASTLAFHLNAYNALALYNVIDAGIPRSLGGLNKIRFFWLRKIRVDGRAMSLYDYENSVIRTLGDPRIHFALNCMSVACPVLPRVPFEAIGLDAQLEAEARKFFADPKHLKIDWANARVQVSEILDFFPEDFLAVAPSLLEYIARYAALPPNASLEFIPYDWTVNRQ